MRKQITRTVLLVTAALQATPQSAPAPHPDTRPTDIATRPLPSFMQHHKRTWIQFETVIPSAGGLALTPVEGQVHYLGGALQSYLNVFNPALISRMRDSISPFGATAIILLAGGRAEIFGGFGGVYVPYATPYTRRDTWLTQTSIGARFAVDSGRHFWLGGSAYQMTDFADKTRQWGFSEADLTIRFGR